MKMTLMDNKILIGISGIVIIVIVGISAFVFFQPNASPQEVIKLNILTRNSSSLFTTFEDEFLKSSFVPKGYSVDLVFKTQDQGLWKTTIDQGDVYVAWGGGPALFDSLMEDNYLTPFTNTSILNNIAGLRANEWTNDKIAGSPMFRNGTGINSDKIFWAGYAISSFGFTINNVTLENRGVIAPSTWNDIAIPTYYFDTPLVSIGSAAGSTSNTRVYEIIVQKFGWNLGWGMLSLIGGNSKIEEGSVQVLTDVETGEVGIANTIDFYGFDSEIQYPDTKYILPVNQSIVNCDPIAFTKNSGDPKKEMVAEAFVNFMLSKYGQAVLLHQNIKRMPIRQDAFNNTPSDPAYNDAPKLANLYVSTKSNIGIDFNDTLSLSYLSTLIYYWEAVINEAHTELRDLMKSAKAAYTGGKITAIQYLKLALALGEPVGSPKVDINYAISINSDMEKNEVTRLSYMNAWRDAAKSKYVSLKGMVDSITPSSDFGISDSSIQGIENPWQNNF